MQPHNTKQYMKIKIKCSKSICSNSSREQGPGTPVRKMSTAFNETPAEKYDDFIWLRTVTTCIKGYSFLQIVKQAILVQPCETFIQMCWVVYQRWF